LEPNRRVVETLGLNAPFEIVNDTIVGLLAGAAVGWGIALVAGTSCNCHGWDKNRQEGKMTGGGLHMGEAAGATELVDKVIQTIARQWTLRGPATRLTEAFVELADARDCEDLLEGVTMGRYELGAAAAPVVFRVAAEGDTVAKDLILWAGRELGDMANGVIRQLDFEALGFDVVLVGSFFNGSQLLVETIRKTVHTIAPDAHVVRLSAPPVVGGVLLGMQQVGLDTAAVRDTLIRSTAELWKREN
jgi:N-acetylglucosamine kinase-like BadF-type ATPase